MGIDVNSLSPSQAKAYWHDYNNGNKNDISEAEYQSLCTKFRDYIETWESEDDNDYSSTETPEDRLEYNADDAGFFGDGNAAQGVTTATVAGGAVATNIIAACCKINGLLLPTAALQLATAIWVKANKPNEESSAACEKAQDELYNEQANLADQILTMEEMQEEMEILQEEANAVNEEGQGSIEDMEGLYNYYYNKYLNGTATENEIKIMKALGAQMQITQADTNETTIGLNEEIVTVGEGYEDITTNINNTNDFTNYVSELDTATRNSTNAQRVILTVAAGAAAITAIQCALRGSALNLFGGIVYFAAAAMAGYAATTFFQEAKTQGNYNDIADTTIGIREETQDLSTETTEYQEVSTEFFEETVEATNEENLYTLTPEYATPTSSSPTGEESGTSSGGAPPQGGTSPAPGGDGTSSPAAGSDDKDKDKGGK